ncbi:helix-turn-helix transcriptional regulator [Streptomyces sp. NBC_01803]|uniref:helix-turn-helix transcriptional regulator n=1 Tax=Streptomyces sp. NBC_01803 TaxID=2975946 RepID=UPI002DDA9B2B|nr:helix-turn-helix transcriptional regulator [Streptomyces sp. NBC_01803]WSA46302.1 helix-turn-helix domain-containing protein [Streptomyces sp. NBC_01803]
MTSVIGANIRRLRQDRGWSQARLARETCRAAGIPGDPIGRQEISRYETGKRTPREWLPFIARALGVTVNDLKAQRGSTQLPVPLPDQDDARGDDYAHAIRRMSRRLIVLDNEMNGLPIADMAARAFKAVHRRLGEGAYEPRYERDIRAAAAELAEIAGWALFNAGKFNESRRFNQEALFLTKLSGDRSTELLILQNMGMLAGWVGRAREEFSIARSVIDQGRLTPRVEAMFRAREAQGLAGLGRSSEADHSFGRARSLLEDSAPDDAPRWAWWITDSEIDRQQGRVLHETEQWGAAIPILQRAMQPDSGTVGYRNVASVRLLACLLAVKAWQAAEEETEKLIPAVSEMSSNVTLHLLARVANRGEALDDAPSSLRDALRHIGEAVNEDPYIL